MLYWIQKGKEAFSLLVLCDLFYIILGNSDYNAGSRLVSEGSVGKNLDGYIIGLIEVLFWTDIDHKITQVWHQVVSWVSVVGIMTRLDSLEFESG
jgi:hypothetical protein